MSTTDIRAGQSIQSAINAASAGDVLRLEVGATFHESIAPKSGVTITSNVPLADRMIAPLDALARIVSPTNEPAVVFQGVAESGLDGVDFLPNVGGESDVIRINDSANILCDRLRLIVPSDQQQKRFILGNGVAVTFRRSYVSGLWKEGQDSQAFCAWDGAGPYRLADLFLEAAGENIMFGGVDSSRPENIPSDISIERVHCTKNPVWKDMQAAGILTAMKNLLELKSARRVVIQDSLFEKCFAGGQDGTAIVFTPRNQDKTAPWTVVEDVLFQRNIVRDSPSGFDLIGRDNLGPTEQTTRIVIRNCDIDVQGRGVMVAAEVGRFEFYNNRLVVPADWPLLTLTDEATYALADGTQFKSPYAAEEVAWYGNDTPVGGFNGPLANGEAAFQRYTKRYSLTGPLPATTPTEPPPVPVPDPLAEVKAELAAVLSEVATAKAATAAQEKRITALTAYLSKLPTSGKVQDVIRYLQKVPR